MQGANPQLCASGSRASGQFSTASRRLGPPGPWHPLHQPGWVLESQGGSRPAAPTGAVQRPPAPNPPGRLHVQACSPPLQRARRSGVGGVSGWAGPAGYVGAGRPGGSRCCGVAVVVQIMGRRAAGGAGGVHSPVRRCVRHDGQDAQRAEDGLWGGHCGRGVVRDEATGSVPAGESSAIMCRVGQDLRSTGRASFLPRRQPARMKTGRRGNWDRARGTVWCT
jgi:hypothetical protein